MVKIVLLLQLLFFVKTLLLCTRDRTGTIVSLRARGPQTMKSNPRRRRIVLRGFCFLKRRSAIPTSATDFPRDHSPSLFSLRAEPSLSHREVVCAAAAVVVARRRIETKSLINSADRLSLRYSHATTPRAIVNGTVVDVEAKARWQAASRPSERATTIRGGAVVVLGVKATRDASPPIEEPSLLHRSKKTTM